MGMLKPRHNLDFSKKPVCADRGTKLRMENLDRDRAPVPYIVGQIDGSHAAPADLILDEVSAG